MTYLALSTVIGALTAYFYLRPKQALGTDLANERKLARWSELSAMALVVLAGARLWAQWQTLGGREAGAFADLMRPMVFETAWGAGLIGQTLLAIVASFAFGAASRRSAWQVGAVTTVLLTVTPALSGHAAAEPRPVVGVTLDTLHVLAGGVWLGTVMVIVALALPVLGDAASRKALQQILVRFSKVALTAAAVVTLTGVYAAWVHVGSWTGLWSTPYGDALVLKLVTVAVVVLLGAINWRVAVPRLTLGRVPGFAASGSAEVFAALLIYLLTAVLVGRPLPME
ncbi:MAG: copper resistance D family protein [Gemmatimonadaceae bacterium]